jgi:hypothetical protein
MHRRGPPLGLLLSSVQYRIRLIRLAGPMNSNSPDAFHCNVFGLSLDSHVSINGS